MLAQAVFFFVLLAGFVPAFSQWDDRASFEGRSGALQVQLENQLFHLENALLEGASGHIDAQSFALYTRLTTIQVVEIYFDPVLSTPHHAEAVEMMAQTIVDHLRAIEERGIAPEQLYQFQRGLYEVFREGFEKVHNSLEFSQSRAKIRDNALILGYGSSTTLFLGGRLFIGGARALSRGVRGFRAWPFRHELRMHSSLAAIHGRDPSRHPAFRECRAKLVKLTQPERHRRLGRLNESSRDAWRRRGFWFGAPVVLGTAAWQGVYHSTKHQASWRAQELAWKNTLEPYFRSVLIP